MGFLMISSLVLLIFTMAARTYEFQRRKWHNLAMLPNSNFAAILPGDSVAGAMVANEFLNIYNTLLVTRLVLTWFPDAPPSVGSPQSTICDPYLNISREIIPPLGGTVDLSPVLTFVLLNAFTSTASTLPAHELPTAEASNGPPTMSPHHTAFRSKWMRRLSRNKFRSSNSQL